LIAPAKRRRRISLGSHGASAAELETISSGKKRTLG
jgi:hypothetical protein